MAATTKGGQGSYHAPLSAARARRARRLERVRARDHAAAVPQARIFAHRTVGSRRDRQRREGQPLRADARHPERRAETGRAEIPHDRRPHLDDPASARRELQIHREEAARPDRRHRGRHGDEAAGAATGGPDLADIRFSAEPKDIDALLAARHLDVRLDGSTVRLSFSGLAAAKADFDACMANIGSPAKGFSKAEFDQLLGQIKRGKAKCSENKRTGVTTCDVD
jgi:hypothetical protein